jgi:ComF family protein
MAVRIAPLAQAANAIVRFALEPSCAGCGQPLDRPLMGPVCLSCLQTIECLPPGCRRCGDDLSVAPDAGVCARCNRNPPPFVRTSSAGRYDGTLRELVHALKYGRRRVLAAPLGRLMRNAAAGVLADADAVVPVPLHPVRFLQRGFNQADDLARQLGLPVWRPLVRWHLGPRQASLPASRRRTNLRRAFAVHPAWRLGMDARICTLRERDVVLIDDVMTTGATLDACARALLGAGVRTVSVLVAARAVGGQLPRPPRPQPPSAPRRR